jgi:hypothetical protein
MYSETVFLDDCLYLGAVVELKPARFAAYSGDKHFHGEFNNLIAATDALIKGAALPIPLGKAAYRRRVLYDAQSISSHGRNKARNNLILLA